MAGKPEYQPIKNYGGNHVFKMHVTADLSYEYMIVGAWTYGEVNKNERNFVRYIDEEALKYNNPAFMGIDQYEEKNNGTIE